MICHLVSLLGPIRIFLFLYDFNFIKPGKYLQVASCYALHKGQQADWKVWIREDSIFLQNKSLLVHLTSNDIPILRIFKINLSFTFSPVFTYLIALSDTLRHKFVVRFRLEVIAWLKNKEIVRREKSHTLSF